MNVRGRRSELHTLRDYLTSDSARYVDWKVTAKTGRLMVREFAREDGIGLGRVFQFLPHLLPGRAMSKIGPGARIHFHFALRGDG